ncbi:MAG: hypothetical protein Kow0042_16530 [Calditrichia bacterium]
MSKPKKFKHKFFFLITLLIFSFHFGCSSGFNQGSEEFSVEQDQDKIFLIDRTGKQWDITHAVRTYKMDPNRFQYGLGPFAIRPILQPEFLNPGDPGYPDEDATFLVIGANLNGVVRAYPISVLNNHEIADDQFGDAHVAVAY